MRALSTTLVFLAVLAATTPVRAGLNIFACEPEWSALAQELGSPNVETFAATHGRQDPHYIRARPSLLAAMRRADLVICCGAGLEVGWLPVLLQKSGKASVQPGAVGNIEAAAHVPLLEVGKEADRSQGDVHPEGNPHIHLDPRNIERIAPMVVERLAELDPSNAAHYQTQLRGFLDRWRAATERWEAMAAPLAGMQIVTHHKSWSYLIKWLDIDLVNTIEAKPGIPPTVDHLRSIVTQVRGQSVAAIIRTPFADARGSEWLSEKLDLPIIVLPFTVGRDDGITDLFTLFDRQIELLLRVRGD